mmetsp:Transcript_34076/g.98220  ORF Transcript_34076/g.98220 Transcript_34076/m.98220 type:complete len:97 (+) Transcript_34076:235-525(+)
MSILFLETQQPLIHSFPSLLLTAAYLLRAILSGLPEIETNRYQSLLSIFSEHPPIIDFALIGGPCSKNFIIFGKLFEFAKSVLLAVPRKSVEIQIP